MYDTATWSPPVGKGGFEKRHSAFEMLEKARTPPNVAAGLSNKGKNQALSNRALGFASPWYTVLASLRFLRSYSKQEG